MNVELIKKVVKVVVAVVDVVEAIKKIKSKNLYKNLTWRLNWPDYICEGKKEYQKKLKKLSSKLNTKR